MSARSEQRIVWRLTAAFALSLLVVLVAASFWIHEQQEDLYATIDAIDRTTAEQIADALYDHLLLGSLLTFVAGVGLAYALARVAVAPVQRLRRREQRLLAEAGHELRTPLAAIALEAELALESAPDEDTAAALRSIMTEAHALAHVADEVLDVARGGRSDLAREPVDLVQLATERVERARRRHGLSAEALELDDARTALALGDRHAIARAIDNLLDNAARHGAPPIRVQAFTEGEQCVVDVVDAGGALANASTDALFAPFARADEARSRPGAGLGLGIVRGIAESLGGSASLGVLDDGRTRARLSLPRA